MANVTLKAKLVLRNDTESNWIKANPVLIKGEMGYCTDKQYLKIGDGTKVFTICCNTLSKSSLHVTIYSVGGVVIMCMKIVPGSHFFASSSVGG